MLLIFILMNFLRKHHLLKDKQKDPTPIKFTASSTFFLTRASQHKIRKNGITFFSYSQLQLCIFQGLIQVKSTFLALFHSLRRLSQTMHFIFLINTTHHDALGFSEDGSPAAMANGGGSVAVRRRSPAVTCSDEVRYGFAES